jgi:hypothetical protein
MASRRSFWEARPFENKTSAGRIPTFATSLKRFTGYIGSPSFAINFSAQGTKIMRGKGRHINIKIDFRTGEVYRCQKTIVAYSARL